MPLGNVNAAYKLLLTDAKGILPFKPCGQNSNGDTALKSVRDILAEKHFPAHAAITDSLL